MTVEEFEDIVASAVNDALASLTKDEVILSLERLIDEIRRGVFDPSLSAA